MITTPTLLLDEHRCRANIRRMCQKADQHKLVLRPHFKTHQSREIGRWFKDEGVKKITVSSLEMAQYFAQEWDDITVAFPINILEIGTINSLASTIQLNVLIENTTAINVLEEQLQYPVGVFLKIDVGYGRTGVKPHQTALLDDLLETVSASSKLQLLGFLAHAGHTYDCRSAAEIGAVHQASMEKLIHLKRQYSDRYPNLLLSYGDTPSCSVANNFTGLDELRPGNFVFYDLTQSRIGSNSWDQIAVAMACPIVAVHEDRRELVLYGGGVHFSKDRLADEPEGTIWGRVVRDEGAGWGEVIPGMYLRSLSQEHGITVVPETVTFDFQVGQIIKVLPVHSCMAANAMKRYLTTDGRWIERL